jgi:LPXTG-motif cell wall-anchored protein
VSVIERLRILPGLIWMLLAATSVATAAAVGPMVEPVRQASPASSASSDLESLPDRSSPPAIEPIVRDVADQRLAESLLLPEAADGWGDVIVGVLQQSSTRPGPPAGDLAAVQEWFVERPDGEMIAIAIPRRTETDAGIPAPRRGSRVEIRAVRIGTLEAVSRDEVTRRWPLFAGRPISTGPMSTATAAIVAATLLAAGGWFLLRRRLAARRTHSIRDVIGSSNRSHVDAAEPPMDLPADPAEALEVLAGRVRDSEQDA